MSKICIISGKKTLFGSSTKHKRGSSGAGGVWRFKAPKTKRTWEPNLRPAKLVKNGQAIKGKVSMSIYKKLRKGEAVNGYTLAALA